MSPRARTALARPGLVSLVVVADPDPAVTTAALERLRGLEPGADAVETILVAPVGAVVDGGVGGDDVSVVRLDAPANLAAARNAGVEAARGSHVAFLAIDAAPRPDWLTTAFTALRNDSRLVAVASKVVDEHGTIGFAGATMTFTGEPVFRHRGESVDEVEDRAELALFASPAAMVVDAQAFRLVGGFDAELTPGVEFADLGWRLWLRGFAIGYEPESVVVGEAWPATDGEGPASARRFGSLAMIYKNYDDQQLGSALAAALLDANRTEAGRAAVAQLGSEIGRLASARAAVQAQREVADAELTPLFRISVATSDADAETEAITEGFPLGVALSQRRRIAIVTPDVLRPAMAGPAIRAWQMAIALSEEHDVQLATTVQCDLTHPDFPVRHVSDGDLHALEAWCDVLIFQGHVLDAHPWLRMSKKVLVVDIYDPFHLEVLEQSRDLHEIERRHTSRITVEVINEQLARGDFFMCASDKQRDFWIGQLTAVGRVNPAMYDGGENLENLISIVPFGVTDEAPVHTRQVLKGVYPGIGADDKVVLWGGGVYNWFDPLTLVSAIDKVRADVPNVRLFFMGMKHPNPNVPEMRMAYEAQRLSEELGLTDVHVFFNEGWVDYHDRQNYLLESDIGVSTHLDHVETAFSFRTRILDYLWASLPIVATSGDSFAPMIDDGLGITVPPNDVDALAEALTTLLVDDARSEACRAAIAAKAPELRWSRVLEPLLAFCRAPRRAADLVDPRQRVQIGDPLAQAMWGQRGWRYSLKVLADHLRRREYEDVVRKVQNRARAFLFPESAGPGARKGGL